MSKKGGAFVMVLTIFASSFSGYALVGVPDEGFTDGFYALRWLGICSAVVLSYIVLMPRLRPLSVARNYISPTDFVSDRFRCRPLTALVSLCLTIPQVIYATSQFVAIDDTVETLSGGDIDGTYAALVLGIFLLVLEFMGGMRAVSYSDAIQGILMVASFLLTAFVFDSKYGGFAGVVKEGCHSRYEVDIADFPFPALASCPSLDNGTTCALGCVADTQPLFLKYPSNAEEADYPVNQILSFVLIQFAFPLSPHLAQRVLSSGSASSLKTAVYFLAIASIFSIIPSIMIGIIRASYPVESLDFAPESSTFAMMLEIIMKTSVPGYILGCIGFGSAIAAIMSTTDSAIMGISNIFCIDFYIQYISPDATATSVLIVAKICSTAVVLVAWMWSQSFWQGGTLDLSELNIWQNSVLLQALPTFGFGFFCDIPHEAPSILLAGILVGFLSIPITYPLAYGFDPGLWALLANTITCIIGFKLPSFDVVTKFQRNHLEAKKDFTRRFGPKELSHDEVESICAHSTEPIANRQGQIFLVIGLACLFFGTSVSLFSIAFPSACFCSRHARIFCFVHLAPAIS
jgi:SSS family solute:Na+ symporter/sodium/pantothenate symporter